MSDLKEYLELKQMYEKIEIITLEIDFDDKSDNFKRKLSELGGYFLVKIQDLEKKAKGN